MDGPDGHIDCLPKHRACCTACCAGCPPGSAWSPCRSTSSPAAPPAFPYSFLFPIIHIIFMHTIAILYTVALTPYAYWLY